MALCIVLGNPNITARHLVAWHLIQTRRHCRYLEHILSTPRSVKLDHIVRQTASSRLHSCAWVGRTANTHDGRLNIGADIQISILHNGRWRRPRRPNFQAACPTALVRPFVGLCQQVLPFLRIDTPAAGYGPSHRSMQAVLPRTGVECGKRQVSDAVHLVIGLRPRPRLENGHRLCGRSVVLLVERTGRASVHLVQKPNIMRTTASAH
jgi:hypothetical protein